MQRAKSRGQGAEGRGWIAESKERRAESAERLESGQAAGAAHRTPVLVGAGA